MSAFTVRTLCGVLVCATGWLAAGGARADQPPAAAKLGSKIEPVLFQEGTDKPLNLYDLKGKNAVVVVFLSFECPVCTSYAQPLADLAMTYGDRGVAFVGISAGTDATPAEVARQAAEFRIAFPVYRDEKRAAATAFAAEVTPEAFVLDANFVLRYRGRIDDAYAARFKKNRAITRHDLRLALDELLAGKAVTTPATNAVGCSIPRETTAAKPASGSVTYYRDVQPIVQNQCQTCHRPGAVGPFALMTYRQAVNWAADIKEYTQSRKMPPWKPVEGPAFQYERRLSEKEIATLAAWVDGGTPAGDPKDAPPARDYRDGWHLGKPDLVLEVNEDFQIGPTGKDLFRCFVLPTDFPEDKYVTAVQVRPGNPRIVHHVLSFVDASGGARELLKKEKPSDGKDLDRGPGYSSSMGVGFRPSGGLSGWAPGQVPHYLPEGTGYLLPKGADVVLQVHYHRDGRIEKDRSAIGLYLAKQPVKKRFWGLTIPGRFWLIPRDNDHFPVKGSIWVQQDCEVYSVMPHMHLLGKEIKVTMAPPEGDARTLVAIKDWDYNWQETYFFQKPIAVKSGTRFDIEAVYDNSAKNANNPFAPPRPVLFGNQTTNEMCFGFLGATSDQPGRIRVRMQPLKDDKVTR